MTHACYLYIPTCVYVSMYILLIRCCNQQSFHEQQQRRRRHRHNVCVSVSVSVSAFHLLINNERDLLLPSPPPSLLHQSPPPPYQHCYDINLLKLQNYSHTHTHTQRITKINIFKRAQKAS